MSEKYYVVSESGLLDVINSAVAHGDGGNMGSLHLLNQAEAACRARPLDPQHMPEALFKALIGVKGYSLKGWVKAPEWATHYYSFDLNVDHDPIRRFEEIKR